MMYQWNYWRIQYNNARIPRVPLLIVYAEGITEAHAQFKEITGIDVTKKMYIAVSFQEVTHVNHKEQS